jgi:altered-inheritance-of-mitochondria protein 13
MARLHAETERLRHEEASIMAKISTALEKENLDKDKPGLNSELLGRDMDEVRDKLEKLGRKRREVFDEDGEKAEVRKQRDQVVQCYL